MKKLFMIVFTDVMSIGLEFAQPEVIIVTSRNSDSQANPSPSATASTAVQQKERPIVVVAPFSKVGDVTLNDAEAVTELFASQLAGHGKLRIVEHGNLDAVLRELKFQTNDWSSDLGKVDAVGKAINAQYVVRGQLMHLGADYFCSVSVIQLEGLEIISSSNGQFKRLEEVMNVLPGMINQISKKMLHVYDIGDIGPGGGIVFYIEGNRAWECSELLGQASWENAKTLCRNYRGGGYSDWYLPTKDELNNIYQNLGRTGIITTNDWYWSSSPGDGYIYAWAQRFSDGYQDNPYYGKDNTYCVRAVRAFSN